MNLYIHIVRKRRSNGSMKGQVPALPEAAMLEPAVDTTSAFNRLLGDH